MEVDTLASVVPKFHNSRPSMTTMLNAQCGGRPRHQFTTTGVTAGTTWPTLVALQNADSSFALDS